MGRGFGGDECKGYKQYLGMQEAQTRNENELTPHSRVKKCIYAHFM